MPEPGPIESLLKEPLSEATRRERRNLLAACAVGIAVTKIGLVPTKISALGIEFSQTEKSRLLVFLAVVVFYFLVAFFVYAVSDVVVWRANFYVVRMESLKKVVEEPIGPDFIEPDLYDELDELRNQRSSFLTYFGRRGALLRALFDFAMPLLVAVYTLTILVRRA